MWCLCLGRCKNLCNANLSFLLFIITRCLPSNKTIVCLRPLSKMHHEQWSSEMSLCIPVRHSRRMPTLHFCLRIAWLPNIFITMVSFKSAADNRYRWLSLPHRVINFIWRFIKPRHIKPQLSFEFNYDFKFVAFKEWFANDMHMHEVLWNVVFELMF